MVEGAALRFTDRINGFWLIYRSMVGRAAPPGPRLVPVGGPWNGARNCWPLTGGRGRIYLTSDFSPFAQVRCSSEEFELFMVEPGYIERERWVEVYSVVFKLGFIVNNTPYAHWGRDEEV